jgi:hypothetical protein
MDSEFEISFSVILEGKTKHQPEQIIEKIHQQLITAKDKLEGFHLDNIHTLSILHECQHLTTQMTSTDVEKETEDATSEDELSVSSIGSDDHAIIEEPLKAEIGEVVEEAKSQETLENVSEIEADHTTITELCEVEKEDELGIVLAPDHIVLSRDERDALFDEFETADDATTVDEVTTVDTGNSDSDSSSTSATTTDTIEHGVADAVGVVDVTEEETQVEENSSTISINIEEASSGYATAVSPVKQVVDKEFILEVTEEDAALITDSSSTTDGNDSTNTSPEKLTATVTTVDTPAAIVVNTVTDTNTNNSGGGWNDSDGEGGNNKADISTKHVEDSWKDSDDETTLRPKSRVKEEKHKSGCSDSGGSQCGDIRERSVAEGGGTTEWKPRDTFQGTSRDGNRRNNDRGDNFRFNDRENRTERNNRGQYNKAPGSER